MLGSKEDAGQVQNNLSQEITATQILYLLGETVLLEIDERAELQYDDGGQPHRFVSKMENGKIFTVKVSEVKS